MQDLPTQGSVLLSIVIPTKDRMDYAKSAIRSVLSIPCSELELVVEDNSDFNQLELWVRDNIADRRLNYNYFKTAVSMSENYDRAMHRARGKYVCLIGDDDGVNPEIIGATRWAEANNLDALVPLNRVHYVWPDLQLPASGAIAPGELRINPFTGERSFPEAEEEMRKCAKDAGQSFHSLPKAYYGIVRRECMQRVREKTGTYFPGVSPDMAAAVAVASYVKRMCQIDYPLFVPGSSGRSNAGIGGMKKHVGRLQDQPHLPACCEKDWSGIVPAFFSVETIWAESAVSALLATGRVDILTDFSVPRLYADLAMWHPAYFPLTMRSFYRALQATKRGVVLGTLQFSYRYLYVWGLRARSLGTRLIKVSSHTAIHSVTGLRNIEEAVRAFTEYLQATGRCFDEKTT